MRVGSCLRALEKRATSVASKSKKFKFLDVGATVLMMALQRRRALMPLRLYVMEAPVPDEPAFGRVIDVIWAPVSTVPGGSNRTVVKLSIVEKPTSLVST